MIDRDYDALPMREPQSPKSAILKTDGLAYVDGRVIPASEATISIEDRGVQFGEAVYEAMVGWNGGLFEEQAHWDRLVDSAKGVALDALGLVPAMKAGRDALMAEAGSTPVMLYVQVSGGVAARDHLSVTPGCAFYLTLRPYDVGSFRGTARVGSRAAFVDDPRWGMARYKTTQLLGNILAKRWAAESGGIEALLVDRDGLVLEGASTSFFIARGDALLTAPVSRNILPGITRAVLLGDDKLNAREAEFTRAEVLSADETFILSTTRPVVPITQIGAHVIGSGRPGPLTRQAADRLDALMDAQLDPPPVA